MPLFCCFDYIRPQCFHEDQSIHVFVVLLPPPDRREAGGAIEGGRRRVALRHLEEKARRARRAQSLDHMIQQHAAMAGATMLGMDADQQQLGFVGRDPRHGKADRRGPERRYDLQPKPVYVRPPDVTMPKQP